MPRDEIQSGDVVQLKSGSWAMTVGREVGNGSASFTCYWFDGRELRTAHIAQVALAKITPRR